MLNRYSKRIKNCSNGDNIVSTGSLYGGTVSLFKDSLPKLGINVKFGDVKDYDELDNRLVRTFPNKLGTPDNGSGRKPVQTVASGSRSKTSGRKNSNKVRLTQSQVAIANRLGVPVEEYAKYVKQ